MRARNIKPNLFKNEILGVADPILTAVFAGLWCCADREGRIEDRPLRLKAEILPYRENIDFNGYLTELARLGFICRYTVENVDVIQVLNFKKHQNPHKTEKPSDLPEMPVKTDSCHLTVKAPLNNGSRPADSLIPDSLIPEEKDIVGFDEPRPVDQPKKVIPYQQIVSYLNEKCATKFKPSSQKTRNLIKARSNEGFTFDDFQAVIDCKCAEWSTDDRMVKYLRPETLFGTKFESYVQDASRTLAEQSHKVTWEDAPI
jgi:uncharacterized phage protein (TIGR02220 family)